MESESDIVTGEPQYSAKTFVSAFEDSEHITYDARVKSEKCRDYFDDKQLTAEEEAALKKRGQPTIVMNEVKPRIKTLMGLEKQTRKDPKAFPRNPSDEDAATAATDAIRYICDDSRWDDVRSAAARNLAIEGTGIVFVGVKQTRQGPDPEIRKVGWDRFYFDPYSAENDFADAEYKGLVVWMDLDEALREYPDARDVLEGTWKSASTSDTYDDKPKYAMWADFKRRRVRVCEHYWREGDVWMRCVFTYAGFVEEPAPSPYLDEDDVPSCPLIAISLYVDRDNNRYGEVQSMLSPQDEINKRRSKSIHTANTRQVRVSAAVAQSADDVRKELARPDGVFIGEQGDVEILNTADMLMGNLNLMQDARSYIERNSTSAALAGKAPSSASGKAIALQQMGGMTDAADYLDAIRCLSLAVYRAVWARVRQFWNAERWIRVTEDEGNVRFVGLNRPVTAIQMMARQMGVTKENMADADPQMVMQLQAVAQDPRSQMVVAVENNVTELDVDILIDEGMDTPTIQAEQFEVVANMLPGAPPNLQPILWEALFANSAFRDKDKVLEALRAPPDPQAQQMEQMHHQMQMAGMQAEIEKTQSETAENLADAEATIVNAQTKAFEAGAKAAA